MNEQPDIETVKQFIEGGIYGAEILEHVPSIVLTNWQVYEVKSLNSRHFVGFNLNSLDGRVSSKIVQYDKKSGLGTTNSGRLYQLVGSPGHNADSEYVWNRWKFANGVFDDNDVSVVTDEYLQEMK